MASTNITSTMLTGLREHITDMVSWARYQINGTWIRAEINSKTVQTNGAVHVSFYVKKAASSSSPATRFQLMNAKNQVLAERTESIAFTQGVETILYRFKFGVTVNENGSA